MARKVLQYTVQNEGRDFGKVFKITEMPSSQAEKWAARVILAMIKGGIELPEGFESAGFAGIAQMGLGALGKLPFETAELLMNEMMACVQVCPNPNDRGIARDLIEDDIEEVATRIKLRLEIWKLHVGFSAAAAPSTSAQA
ncbi:hypothetical protein PF66_06197 [Pseudomonas asplenii]|uniref:Uncharacterized protein n=1 Tax=Pseudomonas asplenii TaxID=53407 RepID=A0A0N0E153_9PSED|nr:hypothetical protein [Pseudomonas fuscovaginae]KPA87287.1 hypothetical protein PF66_06197 [Pseudomonas fuscovaginae]